MTKGRTGPDRMYEDPEEMEQAIADFYDNPPLKTIFKDGQPMEVQNITMTSLARHLGFKSKQSLSDYRKKKGYEDAMRLATDGYLEYYQLIMVHVNARAGETMINAMKSNIGGISKDANEAKIARILIQKMADGEIDADIFTRMINGTKILSDIRTKEELERRIEELEKLAGG